VAAFDLATNGLLPFVADTDADVLALEADATTVWIGGDFSTVNGTPRANLAAVDAASGAVVSGFSADTNDSVHSLEVVGSSLYAGGEYTTIGGVARNRIAKVDGATGAVDAAFTANASHIVRAIAADPTGNPVYLGGDFTQLNGVTDQYLAGVDPATGATTTTFTGNDWEVWALDVSADSASVVGAVAGFGNYAAAWTVATGVREWTNVAMGDHQAVAVHDGVVWFGFHEGFGGDMDVRLLGADLATGVVIDEFRPGLDSFFGVWDIVADEDGLYVGGEFTAAEGVDTRGFAFFPVDAAAPNAPAGFTLDAVSASTASLSWDPLVDSSLGIEYEIRRDTVLVGTVTETTFTDYGLSAATLYDYTVTAVDSAANSSPATALAVTTAAGTDALVTSDLVVSGSTWRYLDEREFLGRTWRPSTFDDSLWSVGAAELGFGDGDETTTVTSGRLAYRFRRDLNLTVPPAGDATLRVKRDDGIAVYVNGTEVYRENLPAGAGTDTEALGGIANEADFVQVTVPAHALRVGSNVVAAEVHNFDIANSDISFDLELTVDTVGSADLVEPDTVIATPTDAATITALPLTIAGTATDNDAVASVSVQIDDGAGNYWDGAAWVTDPNTVIPTAFVDPNWTVDVTGISNGSVTIRAFATDASGNVDTTPATVSVTIDRPASCVAGPAEAESGVFTGTVGTIADANASGGQLAGSTNGSGNDYSSAGIPIGTVTVCITVASAGDYTIDTSVLSPTQVDDSWWVQVDGGTAYLYDTVVSGTITADQVNDRGNADPVVLTLPAGDHTLTFAVREDGAALDTIDLVAVPSLTCAAGPAEAEAGLLSGTVGAIADAGASGGQLAGSVNGSGDDFSSAGAPIGTVSVCITLASAGDYTIDATVLSPTSGDDSWWVQVNGGTAYLYDTAVGGAIASDQVNDRGNADPVVLTLPAGDHTLTFAVREDGAALDTID
ncbi:MAG: hypothetical protein AAGA99_27960, partial [Actinomycetota bacterium]